MLYPRNCDMAFLHRFEKGALSLWSGSIDFVGKKDIGENGAGLELKALGAMLVLNDQVRADDVGGHEVGRKLNPGEPQSSRGGQRSHDGGLPETWRALQKRVTFGKKGSQHTANHIVLADKNFVHLRPQTLEGFAKLC